MTTTICRFCGQPGEGKAFDKWVKPTFTDHDKLKPGDIICNDCLFWFEEKSDDLARITGKEKPQRMRNYSHFIVAGQWTPLSKGDKGRMKALLLTPPFPELAAIAESGQKHIVFRATRNEPGGVEGGWVQFEEHRLWLDRERLADTLAILESTLAHFSKAEFESGHYIPHRILAYGLEDWQTLDQFIKPLRGSLFFTLALFLAQPQEDTTDDPTSDGSTPRDGRRVTRRDLARYRPRLQEPLPAHNLGTVREHHSQQRQHQQLGQVRQLGLFETEQPDTD